MFSFITAICLLGVITVQYGQTTLLPAPTPPPPFTIFPPIQHLENSIPHPTPSLPQPEPWQYEGEPVVCECSTKTFAHPPDPMDYPWYPKSEVPEVRRYDRYDSVW
ncbi:hypothetical protein V3C99_017375 [Haemonchus contortus]